MGVAGLGDTSATLLWASAAAFGVSVTAPILGFYEFFDLLGAKRACISVCGSFIVGAALYFGIALTGSHAPNLAIAAEAMCPLLALPLLLKAWKILPLRADHLAIEHGLLKMPPALLAAMFVYGAAFGLVLSIGTPAETTNLSTLVTNAVYIAVLALVVLALVFKTHRFNIGRVYRPILPLLAVGFILFPVLGQGWMTVTVGIVLAGYACSRIFAATIYADITCRLPAPAMGTAALGGLADAAGIAIGSLVAQGLLAVSGTHAQLVYDVSLVIVGLLIFVTVFLLNESGTSTLWGLLSPAADTPISEATAKARSADVAQAAGLTPREKEVLAYLVRGKPAAEIASELVLSEATVRTHTKRIYTKLGVHSRAELLGAVYFADSPSDHTMA